MRLYSVFLLYLMRRFGVWYLTTGGAIFGLVLVATTIETTRRLGGKVEYSFFQIAEISFLTSVHPFYQVGPLIALFACAGSYQRLSRQLEIDAMSAVGLSQLSLLLPVGLLAVAVACFFVGVIQPLSVGFKSLAVRAESGIDRSGADNDLLVQTQGKELWFRSQSSDGEILVLARVVADAGRRLEQVTAFQLDQSLRMDRRLDIERVGFRDGRFQFTGVLETDEYGRRFPIADFSLETSFVPERIQESYSGPSNTAVWELPQLIRNLGDAGFPVDGYEIELYRHLSLPLMFLTMAIIGALTMVERGRKQHPMVHFLLALSLGIGTLVTVRLVVTFASAANVPTSLATVAAYLFLISLVLAALHRREEG